MQVSKVISVQSKKAITEEREIFHNESYSYRRSTCSFFVSVFIYKKKQQLTMGKYSAS